MTASTAKLLQYAFAYFALYVITGVSIKFFEGARIDGFLGFTDLDYLVYSTIGSAAVCLGVIFGAGWLRFAFHRQDILAMLASGFCTAIVLPTTTLLYSLPVSVMVAMTVMRGSIICVSRFVDAILRWQGLATIPVRREENFAIMFAMAGVSVNLFHASGRDFHFLDSPPALWILGSYILFYAIRIYCMNYFKQTRGNASLATNKNYFAGEQVFASVILISIVALVRFTSMEWLPFDISTLKSTLQSPPEYWGWATLSGAFFGASAFFSVFLFLFQDRNSTFSTLVNRVSSLLAGITATLLFALLFKGSYPKALDWLGVLFILIAVYFLSVAEKKNQLA